VSSAPQMSSQAPTTPYPASHRHLQGLRTSAVAKIRMRFTTSYSIDFSESNVR
jgi:hypothetical protein